MNYPIVLGNDDIATKFGGLLGMPTSFLITRDGKIAKRIHLSASNPKRSGAVEKDIESQL